MWYDDQCAYCRKEIRIYKQKYLNEYGELACKKCEKNDVFQKKCELCCKLFNGKNIFNKDFKIVCKECSKCNKCNKYLNEDEIIESDYCKDCFPKRFDPVFSSRYNIKNYF